MLKKPTPEPRVERWHAVAHELLARPGIVFVTLLTDEAGCKLLAQGIIPAYLQEEAVQCLDYMATDERGLVVRLRKKGADAPPCG